MFGVAAKPVHFTGEEMLRETKSFAQSLQPFALFVKEVSQPIAGLARVPEIEGDELFGRELRVSAERFENSKNVILGDRRSLAARGRV
jgi:hypothetical protein